MHHDIHLLVNLAVSLALALVLGLITDRLRLSPIVGYLLAGVLLGPYTPGLAADAEMARQFAEIGVVLLMFGVGLHFHLEDLWAVRKVAVPGAVGQIIVAAAVVAGGAQLLGRPPAECLILGLAASVASTVVLVRVLTDNNVLDSPQGHIAVGWLIVEDIFTVLVLVALPAIGEIAAGAGEGGGQLLRPIGLAVVRIVALAILVLGGGRRLIPWLLGYVARTRSRELFTLSILALALAIATGSTVFFGVSMALGAFLAGMIVGQTEVSHQAAADALPMRDAFAVLFFVSSGMLFDPHAIVESPALLALLLAVVLVVKPLAALGIVWLLRYSWQSALTIAVALAQIGEFSFLLADAAVDQKLLSDQGRSLLVACALISITINPLWFRALGPIEAWFRRRPRLWRLISARAESGGTLLNAGARRQLLAELAAAEASAKADGIAHPASAAATAPLRAVIVGYGPVGQTAARILRDFNIRPVVIDLNLDTVRDLTNGGELAVYGDATRRDILEAAAIGSAKYLLVTVPDVLVRTLVILAAKDLNPDLRIFARARYIQERAWLEEVGATQICTEEAETAVGLAMLLLREIGADEARVRTEIEKIEAKLGVQRLEIG